MDVPPTLVPVAFKEWSSVCAAIGSGRQSIILRKGGIAEGRTGFSFTYDRFFLFPTLFHEQDSSVREQQFTQTTRTAPPPRAADDSIAIDYFAEIQWKGEIDDWQKIRRLEPLHIWKDDVIRQRFRFGDAKVAGEGKGSLQLAVVRVWQLAATWWIADDRAYGGCRSWVKLPEIPQAIANGPLRPVVERRNQNQLVSVLGRIGVNVSV